MSLKSLITSLVQIATGHRREPTPPPNPDRMDFNTPFSRLLAEANDSDLVDATFLKIVDRLQAGRSTAPPEEQVIQLVYHSLGIIGNGGFEYLFSGTFSFDPEFLATAEAHRNLGLTRSYEAFQRDFALFPELRIPHNGRDRIQIYKQTDETVREEINRLYWQDDWDKLSIKRLAEDIRENAEKLGDLDSKK